MFHLTNHEVFAVTARFGDRNGAQIATWVIPVTLVPDRLRVVIAQSPLNFTFDLVAASRRLCLHLLAADQADLLPRLGLVSQREHPDKLRGLSFYRTPSGLPYLPGTCGVVEMQVVDRLDSGDRVLWLCDALHLFEEPPRPPLRHKDALERLPVEVVEALAEKRRKDGERDRALFRDYGVPPPGRVGPSRIPA